MIRVFFLGPCFKAGTVSFYNLQQILHNFLLQPCRGRRQTKGSGGTAQTSVFKQFCCRRTRCCCCCFCLLLLLGLISCFEGSSAFSLPFNRPQAHIRHLNSPCPASLSPSLSLALTSFVDFCCCHLQIGFWPQNALVLSAERKTLISQKVKHCYRKRT